MSNQTPNYNKLAAMIFGAVFVLVGLLGFVGALTPNGGSPRQPQLLGLFAVSPLHNVIHLAGGVVLLVAAFVSAGRGARATLLAFGAVYTLVTVLGFVAAGLLRSLGVAINGMDNVLHLVLAIALLGVPLAFRDDPASRVGAATR